MFGSLRVVTGLVGFTMMVTTSDAGAQAPTSGVAVRWHDGATVVKAQVHELPADGKVIVQRRDGSTVMIDPRTTPIAYRTKGRTKWGNAGIGFGVGAGIGVIAGLVDGDDDPGTWFAYTAGQKAVMGGLSLGLLGAVVGAIVIPAGKWVQVRPGSVSFSLAF